MLEEVKKELQCYQDNMSQIKNIFVTNVLMELLVIMSEKKQNEEGTWYFDISKLLELIQNITKNLNANAELINMDAHDFISCVKNIITDAQSANNTAIHTLSAIDTLSLGNGLEDAKKEDE